MGNFEHRIAQNIYIYILAHLPKNTTLLAVVAGKCPLIWRQHYDDWEDEDKEGDEIEEREAPGNAAVTYWCYTVLHWDRVHTTRWLINTLFTLWIHYNTDQDLYINKYLPFYSTYSFSLYRNEKSLAHDFTIHYIALWEDQKSEIIKRSIFYVQSITWRKNSETLYIGLLYRHIGVYFCSLPAWSFSVICRYSFECLFLSKSLLRSQINKYSFVSALLSNHLRQTSALTVSWCDLSLIIESVTSTQSKHTENFISSQFRASSDCTQIYM